MSSVSYVIPVFNKSSFLKPVINVSKISQGLLNANIYLLMTDQLINSYKIISSLTKDLKNCFILRQKNLGSANATNKGIKKAKMKYIKFLDADDIILRETTKIY